MAAPGRINSFLQKELASRGLDEVAVAEAAVWLDEAELLPGSPARLGKPLRVLLRDGGIDGADQRPPVSNGRWFITRTASSSSENVGPAPARTASDPTEPDEGGAETEAARVRYEPGDVRVLFIGESRPAGGTFFYFANSILYEATREAFAQALPEAPQDDFLDAFRGAGCYLEDLCSEPVNRMATTDRQAARSRSVPELAARLDGLEPDLVIIVMKAIAMDVERALARAGLDGTPTRTVPFPRRERRGKYVEEVAGHLARWQAVQ